MAVTASAAERVPRAGAPGRRWRDHTAVLASLAAVLGSFATPVGAGISVRYLTKAGLSSTVFLGLLILLVGVGLLAFVVGVAWHRTQRWQRLWFIPTVVVALMVMWSVAVGTMLAVAPRAVLGSTTPASRGLTYSDVTFRTSDGVQLSAWYVRGSNRAAIVTMPGSGSTRVGTLAQAAALAHHGYGVLLVDPRGQGRSGGRAMDAGWYGDRDVTAAVGFLRQQKEVDPTKIGVLGLSMGGEEAIGAAAVDPTIRAVIAEGATHRTAADKAGYLPSGVAGVVQRGLDWLTYGTAALLSPAPEPGTLRNAIVHSGTTRYLLIAAGKGVDEAEAVAPLRAAAPDRVQTWIVPGATHTHGLSASPSQWEQRVTEFLQDTLGVAPR